MKTRYRSSLTGLWRQSAYICLTVFAIFSATTMVAQAQDEPTDSPTPVLISETNSTRALATYADKWRGNLPKAATPFFQPGADSRAVVFVTNLDLEEGEGADAFRVYAEDRNGKIYRLTTEGIAPLRKQPWIYGVTVQLYDENGFNGQPQANGDVLLRLTWRGITSNRVVFGLGENTTKRQIKVNEDLVPTPAPLEAPGQPEVNFANNTAGDRGRFMEQAAFGPAPALELRLRQIGIKRWIEEQFYKQPTFAYPNLIQRMPDDNPMTPPPTSCYLETNPALCRRDTYQQYRNQRWMFQEALYGQDQLRRRVSWALSQIWVISAANNTGEQQRHIQEQIEILDRNAFGNYRTLMLEMTLNPQMGNYLDMVRSTKNNPNENYPREILQLFSVGLDMLNQNGTPIMSGGNRVPSYDQEKVNQFTKVFTGWSRCNQAPPVCPNNTVSGVSNYIDPMILSGNPSGTGASPYSFGNNHDLNEKLLFNYPGAPNATIPACGAACVGATAAAVTARRDYATASLNKTLDNIFYHPNVGPFIGKLLIQHLVTSDPTPAYVGRVAAAFNNDGNGVRGDMRAVIKAILLDPEARGSIKNAPDYGKLREPFQYATNLLRTFDVKSSDRTQLSDGFIAPQTNSMGQNILYSPSVFNYFPPDYNIPGTDIVGPEFALYDTRTSFNRINFINRMVYDRIDCNRTGTPAVCNPVADAPLGTSISLAEPAAWAAQDTTGDALIEGLNRKMMHGAMSQAMKDRIRTALTPTVTTPVTAPLNAMQKAQQAVYLVASSSQYQVQR